MELDILTEKARNNLEKGPQMAPTAWAAPGARLSGDVRLEGDSSVWYNSVIRGDYEYISIGERTNIQDGSILHVDYNLPCIIGRDVTVGHHCNLHGCIVGDSSLIGIGAIVLSGARIGRGCIIAAGSVVLENTVVEDFSLYAGIPAKKKKNLDESILEKTRESAEHYRALAALHRERS